MTKTEQTETVIICQDCDESFTIVSNYTGKVLSDFSVFMHDHAFSHPNSLNFTAKTVTEN